jgi:hypothetical protein
MKACETGQQDAAAKNNIHVTNSGCSVTITALLKNHHS